MSITTQDILLLIPQRPPFVMIDIVTGSGESVTCSRFQVKKENVLVEKGRLQESGLVENIAQTAAAGAGYNAKMENKPVAIGYIGSVNNLLVYSLPAINDELETEVTVVNRIFNVTLIKGNIRCRGELVAQCEMKIFITQTK